MPVNVQKDVSKMGSKCITQKQDVMIQTGQDLKIEEEIIEPKSITREEQVIEGKEILSVSFFPGTIVDVGTEVTFDVVVRNNNEKIKSVTCETSNNMGNNYVHLLELSGETNNTKTYTGSFIFEKPSTHTCTMHILTTTNHKSSHKEVIMVNKPKYWTGSNIQVSDQFPQSKLFYICLCLFFVLGALATAFIQGDQLEMLPDMSWKTPENFVGYFNNYINQKVNPTTIGDVLVTEYITHPGEPTGVVPLYPTQSVVQEMTFVNTSITELEMNIAPGEDISYGTTVGVAVFTQTSTTSGKWTPCGYETVTTAGYDGGVMTITVKTPHLFNMVIPYRCFL